MLAFAEERPESRLLHCLPGDVAGQPLIAQNPQGYSASSAHTSAACSVCGYMNSASGVASTGSCQRHRVRQASDGALFVLSRSATRACLQVDELLAVTDSPTWVPDE